MSINPITMMMFQPLGAKEAQSGLGGTAVTPPTTTTPAAQPAAAAETEPAAEPEKDTSKIAAGDTVWALVKDRLGPDATDRDIFNATQKVLKANGETWESAKKMRVGDEVDFSVLSEGKKPAAPEATGQPLGAAEAAEAGETADETTTAESETEPKKDTSTIKSGDTIWALVKDRLGPDATDREIFNATEQVLKANGETWESAKGMHAGDVVDFSVLGKGKETPTEAPAAEEPTGQPLGAVEAQRGAQQAAPTGLPLGAVEAQSGLGGAVTPGFNVTPQAPFTGSAPLDNLLLTTFGALDPSVQQFLPFSLTG